MNRASAVATAKGMGSESTAVALATTAVVPLLAHYLYFCISFNGGAIIPGRNAQWDGFFSAIPPTHEAVAVYCGWLAFQVFLYLVLPGPKVEGLPLGDDSRLRYRLNGSANKATQASNLYPLMWLAAGSTSRSLLIRPANSTV